MFTVQHRSRTKNEVADALCRRNRLFTNNAFLHNKVGNHLFTIMHSYSTKLENINELYSTDKDFSDQWAVCIAGADFPGYRIHESFLFYEDRIHIPNSPIRWQLIQEIHHSALSGHYG